MLEAMKYICSLVASNTPPVTEYVKHNHNGLLVDFLIQLLLQLFMSLSPIMTLLILFQQITRQTILDNYSIDVFLVSFHLSTL